MKKWVPTCIILVGFLGCALLYFCVGFYYEDHSGLASLFQSGIVTGGRPASDFYIYCQTFTSAFFSFLTLYVAKISWVDFAYIFLLFMAYCFSATMVLNVLFPQPIKKRIATIFSILFFVLFFADSFVFFSWVRLSYIGTFLLLLGCLWVTETNPESKLKWWLYFFTVLLFSLCLFIRYETGIAACVAVGVYLICRGGSMAIVSKALALPFVITALFIVYLYFKADEIPFLKQTEPALYYISDAVNNPNFFSSKPQIDSIKNLAVLNYFIIDEGIITVDFIQSMATQKTRLFSQNSTTIFENLKVAYHLTLPFITKYVELVLLHLVAFLFLLRKTKGSSRLGIFVFNLFIAGIVVGMAYGIKMEDRIFISLLITGSICNLLFIEKISIENRKIGWVIRLAIAVLLLSFSTRFVARAVAFKKETLKIEHLAHTIDRRAKGKYLYLDVHSNWLLRGALFRSSVMPNVKQILFYDAGQLGLLPFFKTIADNTCQCKSAHVDQYFHFLQNEANNLILISTINRMGFIKGYLELVHHQKIVFEQGEKITDGNDLYYFTIKQNRP